ncbi:sugar phosphate isomerase/epimerase family protein [Agilicoccus flavus]|uniref:sugar phosphate isomerase/epimerase family protein n=1 Tax=Agilicoccus flavus TaxID=2775968 RepID=UPI001CF6E579|nr:TIM barrel protein [Agilicoccus flavus]
MWTLSGFADEIDPDFATQCAHVRDLGLSHLEFRSAWGVNVLDLDAEQRARARGILAEHGLAVSSIGSPIGKIGITEAFEPHLARFRHCLDVAEEFEAPFIRLFSFFVPEGDDPASHRDEVIARSRAFAQATHDHPYGSRVTLLHENEKEIYGDTPVRCLDLIERVADPAYRLTWDPANFVQVGVARPFDEGYAALRPHVVYLQLKDAVAGSGEVVPSGEGDGQVRETIRALAADGFDGFLSLEPHLATQDSFGGFSGADEWSRAHAALVGILREEGIEYR